MIATPSFVGRRYLDDVPLGEIAKYIDWTFFFSAWELKGRFPASCEHPQYGAAARELFENAQALLKRIIDEKLLDGARRLRRSGRRTATATTSSSTRTRTRREELARLPMLRQQEVIADSRPNLSLADFIAPKGSGVPDYLGMFAVTAGIGAEELAKRFEADHDDYNAIMVKALADRLAEAFAEYLHAAGAQRLGLRRRRAAVGRGSDRREAPRHPSRARLSRVPGSQREVQAVNKYLN